jgi:hypothetical protein
VIHGSCVSLFLGLLRENLAAAVHAGLEIDMMRTPQLAGILVFHIGWCLERIGGTPESALHPGGFAFRNGHVAVSKSARAMELRCAVADLRASYNEILCLTILECVAAAAMLNLISDGSSRILFNAFDEWTGG